MRSSLVWPTVTRTWETSGQQLEETLSHEPPSPLPLCVYKHTHKCNTCTRSAKM